jgi:PAS domain S-box-containing protein
MDFSHQELFIVVGFMAAAVLGLLLFVSTRMTIARINREMENRRDVERELRISESRLREAMQGTDTGLWEWNPQSGEIYLDTVWFTMLGHAVDAMPHTFETFESLLHPDDRAAALEVIEGIVGDRHERFEVELRMRCSDGSYRWILSKGRLLETDTAGNVTRLIGIHTDITEQKMAQEALHESEQRFRRLVAQSPVSIQVHDINGKLVMSNPAYARLYGLNEQTLAELYDKYNVRHDDQARQLGLMPFIEKTYKGEDVVFPPYEYDGLDTLKTLDFNNPVSRKCWVQSRGFPLKDELGRITSVVFMSEDITARKKYEQEVIDYQHRLKEVTSELARAEERERRSIATDLHDHVGQSLAVLRMQLAAAIDRTTDPDVVDALDGVSESLRQAIQETRNIMYDISSPMLNEFGLSAAISEWLKVHVADKHGLQTQFSDDGEAKPLGEDTRAILFRNVRELLVNVVKHAAAQRVSVDVARTGDSIAITVEDDGRGAMIDMTKQQQMQGRGFGLFSIEERMRDLGGLLTIESTPCHGFRAVIIAPLEFE